MANDEDKSRGLLKFESMYVEVMCVLAQIE